MSSDMEAGAGSPFEDETAREASELILKAQFYTLVGEAVPAAGGEGGGAAAGAAVGAPGAARDPPDASTRPAADASLASLASGDGDQMEDAGDEIEKDKNDEEMEEETEEEIEEIEEEIDASGFPIWHISEDGDSELEVFNNIPRLFRLDLKPNSEYQFGDLPSVANIVEAERDGTNVTYALTAKPGITARCSFKIQVTSVSATGQGGSAAKKKPTYTITVEVLNAAGMEDIYGCSMNMNVDGHQSALRRWPANADPQTKETEKAFYIAEQQRIHFMEKKDYHMLMVKGKKFGWNNFLKGGKSMFGGKGKHGKPIKATHPLPPAVVYVPGPLPPNIAYELALGTLELNFKKLSSTEGAASAEDARKADFKNKLILSSVDVH